MSYLSGISVALPEFAKRVRQHPVINRVSGRLQRQFRRAGHIPHLPTAAEIARLNKDLAGLDEPELRLLLLDGNYRLLKAIDFGCCDRFGILSSFPFLPTVLAVRNGAARFALAMNDPTGSLSFDGGSLGIADSIKTHARLYGIDCIDVVVVEGWFMDGGVDWRSLFDPQEEALLNRAQTLIPPGCCA